jgi:hypothetical protein
MAYVAGKNSSFTFSNSYFTFQVVWSETYDVASNTSIVSIDAVKLKTSSYSYTGAWYPDFLIKINDETVVEFDYDAPATHIVELNSVETYYNIVKYGDGSPAPWKSSPITHNNDGSKNITISIVPNSSSTALVYRADKGSQRFSNVSQNIDLATIPRSSTFALSTYVVDVENDITVDIYSASDTFRHTVEFYINDSYYQKYEDVYNTQTYNIPASWYDAMPSSTSCMAYCRVTTYNNGIQIGEPVRRSFSVNVPDVIIPVVGQVVLTPSDINENTILVKGKNALTISVSDCEAGVGSTIQSYAFIGPSVSTIISRSENNASINVSSVSEFGELVYMVKVTDARGRSASNVATIECYDYYAPTFTSFNAYRADADQLPNINGSYIKCDYSVDYADVNGTNSVSVVVNYNENTSDNPFVDLFGDTNTTYKVSMTVTDSYGGTNKTSVITIFGESRVLNITSDGTGMAIGKMAESSELFECRWNAKFNKDISGDSATFNKVDCKDVECEAVISDKINCDEFTISQNTIFELIYPVGSIYMSVNNVPPETLFGGTWEQIEDTFLLAAGGTYAAGTTGGEATHTLTVNEMPSHAGHLSANDSNWNGTDGLFLDKSAMQVYGTTGRGWTLQADNEVIPAGNSAGGGAAHNNMPPYLAVFMWKRIA